MVSIFFSVFYVILFPRGLIGQAEVWQDEGIGQLSVGLS